VKQVTLVKPECFESTEVPAPERAPGEALVRSRCIGVCGTDLHAFAGRQPFFTYPRVLGHELGVEVLDVEPNDRGIQPGTRCAVEPYLHCGRCRACRCGKTNCCERLRVLGVHTDGGMRSVFSVPVDKLHPSDQLSFEQLALVETLGIGAHAVERASPLPGESTVVIGTGPIGLAVIQSLQAAQVRPIVADLSETRLAFCRKWLGLAHTVNPREGDFAELLRDCNGGDLPTLVIDATGHRLSMAGTFDLAAHGGRIVFVGLFVGELSFDDPNFHRRELTLLASRNARSETLREVIAQIEAGRIDTSPWITHRLALKEVPAQFASLPAAEGLIKAMIHTD